MFEVGGGRTIGRDDGPTVAERLRFVAAEIDHGLDREGHAGPDLVARALAAEVRNLRLLVHRKADPVTDHVAHDAEAVGLDVRLDGIRDVADASADLGFRDAEAEGLFGHLQEALPLGRDRPDGDGGGVVADVAVVGNHDVDRDDVAIAQDAAERGDAMHHFFIDRDAGVRRIAAGTQLVTVAGAAGTEAVHDRAGGFLEILRTDARPDDRLRFLKDRRRNRAGLAHVDNLPFVFERDHRAGISGPPRGGRDRGSERREPAPPRGRPPRRRALRSAFRAIRRTLGLGAT